MVTDLLCAYSIARKKSWFWNKIDNERKEKDSGKELQCWERYLVKGFPVYQREI